LYVPPVLNKDLADGVASEDGDLIAAVHAAAPGGQQLATLASSPLPAAKPLPLLATEEVLLLLCMQYHVPLLVSNPAISLLLACGRSTSVADVQMSNEEEPTGRNVRQRVQDGLGAALKLPGAVTKASVQHPAAIATAGLVVAGTGLAVTLMRRGGVLKGLFWR
jgi:hypothetical protein